MITVGGVFFAVSFAFGIETVKATEMQEIIRFHFFFVYYLIVGIIGIVGGVFGAWVRFMRPPPTRSSHSFWRCRGYIEG
jgi:hypothetical protein